MHPTFNHLLALCLILGSPAGILAEEDLASDGLELVARAIQKCGRLSELGTCLRMKAVTVLDRAIHGGPLVINEYLSLTPEESEINSSRPITEREIEASLPRDESDKVSALDDMLSEKLSTFIKSRSIKFHVPTEEGSNNIGDGRGRKGQKGGGYMMMGGMFLAMMMQLKLGTLLLLAGKAFIVAKMALVLASITGLKKLLSSSGGESHQVIYATAGHEGGGHHEWGRAGHHEKVYSAHARTYGKR